MQRDMPNGADNPFTAGHREAARKAIEEAEKQRMRERDDRATAKGKLAREPAKPIKGFVPVKPFWVTNG